MRRRTTGITRRSLARIWKVARRGHVAPKDRSGLTSLTGRPPGREVTGVETSAVPGVARGPHLVDPDQQGIAVAVQGDGVHELYVATRVALAPVLAAAARPEGHA